MFKRLMDGKGTALVIAMVLLTVLTLIGMAAINSSTTEIAISGNYKLSKEASFAAEMGLRHALVDPFGNYFTSTNPQITTAFPGLGNLGIDDDGDGNADTNASGTIRFITSGKPPVGYGVSAKSTARYYLIDSTGTASLNAMDTQQMGIAQIIPPAQ